jgi:hypothetical protein
MQYLQFIKKFFSFAVIALSFVSCQEPFDFDDFDSKQNIPVFEGSITDEPGPYKVSLYYAKPFNVTKSTSTTMITNAKVYIKDNYGKTAELSYDRKNSAYYTAVGDIRGIVGRKYRLYVKFTNGNTYESIPAALESAETIDSLYAEPGSHDYTTYDAYGDAVKKTYKGINIYADINSESVTTKYYKFNTSVIWQHTRILNPGSQFPSTLYIRIPNTNTDDLPNIKSSISYNNSQLVKKHQIVFLPYIPDMSSGIDSPPMTPYVNMGWIVQTIMNTTSHETFNYYQAVYEQLKAGSQLFDPIPTQIKGNIICRTDTTQLALGLFNVYSKITRCKAFYWIPEHDYVKTKNVSDPGPFISDTATNVPPPYWVSF